MATEEGATGGAKTGEQDDWATQDRDGDQAEDVETAIFEGEDGKFQVQTIRPLVLLRNASQFGVLGLLSGETNEDAVQDAMASGGFNRFMDNTVVPAIQKPEGCYWTVPDGGAPPDGYDLADMGGGMEDLFGLIEAMTGATQEELAEQAEELAGNR